MDIEDIAQLLRPYATLSAAQLARVSAHLDLLLKWNARMNLTAVREPDEIVTRHFGESLFLAAQLLQGDSRIVAIDVGSGAGFPGLPLAIYAPEARVTLIESSARKAVFLNEAIAAIGLANAAVFNRRAEDFGEKADVVTMRAVEKFDKAVGVAAQLVKDGGRLALMIGRAQEQEARQLLPMIEWQPSVAIPGSQSRTVWVGTRVVKVG